MGVGPHLGNAGPPGELRTGALAHHAIPLIRILLSWDDAAWMLDFGTRFAATSRYFEEFVKPRGATLGLRDYLRMGLLPPLEGLYRDDLCCHEPDLWQRYRNHPDYRRVPELKGVLLHGA